MMAQPDDDADFWQQIKVDLESINQRIHERAKWQPPQEVRRRDLAELPTAEMVATVMERRDRAIIRAWESGPRVAVKGESCSQ